MELQREAGLAAASTSRMIVAQGLRTVRFHKTNREGLQIAVAIAPCVWKAITAKYGVRGTDFFWSSHDNAGVRRSTLERQETTPCLLCFCHRVSTLGPVTTGRALEPLPVSQEFK